MYDDDDDVFTTKLNDGGRRRLNKSQTEKLVDYKLFNFVCFRRSINFRATKTD